MWCVLIAFREILRMFMTKTIMIIDYFDQLKHMVNIRNITGSFQLRPRSVKE